VLGVEDPAPRVVLARAVLLKPCVILASEPTANLDDEAAAASLALLQAKANWERDAGDCHPRRPRAAFFAENPSQKGFQRIRIGRRPL